MTAFTELYIDQGATFNNVIYINDDLTNTMIDLTNYTFTGQLRRSYYSISPSANLTCTITDAANGELTISMTASQTAAIKAGRYLFDVKAKDAANSISRVIEGIITVTPQITR